ncbi:hypothetical protein BC829DRAFT_384514 [Chytridium lagenaria]|nr:hypothetical protein BC829DRAFT_384514 [Chytridium lagenaria]
MEGGLREEVVNEVDELREEDVRETIEPALLDYFDEDALARMHMPYGVLGRGAASYMRRHGTVGVDSEDDSGSVGAVGEVTTTMTTTTLLEDELNIANVLIHDLPGDAVGMEVDAGEVVTTLSSLPILVDDEYEDWGLEGGQMHGGGFQANVPPTFVEGGMVTQVGFSTEKRPARLSVETSTLVRLARHCPMVRHLNLAFCPLSTDYLIAETGEYLSSLHPVAEYLTRIPVTPVEAVKEIVERCEELVSLDLRGCDWVTGGIVEMVVGGCRGLRALNLVRCARVRSGAAKLWLCKDAEEMKRLVLEALKT